MLTFALFPIALFFLGAVLVTGLPVALSLQSYYQSRGRKTAICPDSGHPVAIEVDDEYAFWTALRGQEHSRLKSCTRWPEKADCGQECLAQVNPSPENVDRLLSKWYEGKSCAICERGLSPSDWRRSRLALLNEQHKLFELRHMHLDELQSTLQHMRPLCWNCHQEERARQAAPSRFFKGDRHGLIPAVGK
jgi:hypothetical protein